MNPLSRSARPILLPALALLLAAAPPAARAGFEADFAAANALYEEGRFQEAAAAYEKILQTAGHSSAVHYNLANTLHRLGEPGRAVLHYERALLLNPSHPEARANLEFVRRAAGAREFPPAWQDRVFRHVPPSGIAWTAAAAGWAALAGLWLALRRSPWRAHGLVALLMAAPLAAACLWLLVSTGGGAWNPARAVILADKTAARHAPVTNSRELLTLRAGSEVRVLTRRAGWAYVLLPDGGRGWLPGEALAEIRPPAPGPS